MLASHDTSYYELQKKVELLKHKQRLKQFREQLQPLNLKLENLHRLETSLQEDVCEMQKNLDKFNSNKPIIVKRLQSPKFLNIPQHSAASLKELTKEALEILFNPIKESNEASPVITETCTKDLLHHFGKKLQLYREAYDQACSLFTNIKHTFSEDKENMPINFQESALSSSDDTPMTILSEDVYASSPI